MYSFRVHFQTGDIFTSHSLTEMGVTIGNKITYKSE